MIPVFEPAVGEEEIRAVTAAMRRGEISGTFGRTIARFEEEFARYCGCRYGVATSSGTAALHLAVAALEIKPGDEVLVSASTNVATALAVYHNGGVPVPVDSEDTPWNLNLDLMEALITPRTRAVLAVHLYGHPVDMERLCGLAGRHELTVIEDCAQAHGAICRGRKVGSFGRMGCFSFYANKVITTGEGGMVTTDDPVLAQRLRSLRNLAFQEPRFHHETAGYNFRMTGFQAAMGRVQLNKIEQIIAAKRRVAKAYEDCLSKIEGLQLPVEKEWARNVYWVYGLVVKPGFGTSRDALVAGLGRAGIQTRTFFCPMNRQPFLRSQPGFRDVPCPVADSLWENGLYLPSSPSLKEETIRRITDAVRTCAG